MHTIKQIRETTEEAMERLATEVLNLDFIHKTITAAAKQGFCQVMIKPPLAVKIARTEVAEKITNSLEAEGYSVMWDMAPLINKGPANPYGLALQQSRMTISWEV